MKVQVLGMGCPKCGKMYEAAEKAIAELGLTDCELEKVQSLDAISAMGVMMTPALAVDGKVLLAGRVPSVPDMKLLLGTACRTEG